MVDTPGNSYDLGTSYDGSIDDFIWVDGVMTDYEIKSYFNDGYVARYELDGNFNDLTSNGYDGVPSGSPTFTSDRFGNAGAALVLDGIDDQVDLGTDPIQHIAREISLSAWVKGDDINAIGGIVSWWIGFRLEIRNGNEGRVTFGP